MNPNVLRRFITYLIVATFATGLVWVVILHYQSQQPGDFEVKQGSQRLDDELYDEALAHFDKALDEMPNHRGALMGRALVFIERKQYELAVAELTHLIGHLEQSLEADDRTGWAALAAAYANRGIVHDREGRHEAALADYVQALKVDEGAVEGPGWINKLLYGTPNPSTIRDRARYIHEQLKLPEEQRVLRVPQLDELERAYKPR
ncbi:MAG: hypothetical protein QNJ94_17255 [Alphaproteobacteria bacterium]|nr:hypothetical protein [Alphaproteobacteria bacterium]